MGILGIKDIIDLAKAGFKPADIKELLNIEVQKDEKPSEPAPAEPAPAKPAEPIISDAQPATENTPKESVHDQLGTSDKEDNIDYKSKYEETLKELKELQKNNILIDQSKNIEKPKTVSEILADIL